MKSTIKDVAELAGVSIATVSRVINGNYPVKTSTRNKVESAINELQFTPNSLARSLIQNKTYTIGVVTPSLTNSFFPIVVTGIQQIFQNLGYHILLSDSGGEAENEKRHINHLIEHRVDGVIVLDPRTANIKDGFYEKISAGLPLVLVNGYHENIPLNFVINNQEEGTRKALNYLYTLGHRHIAFMRGKKSHSYDLKEEVYNEFLNENKLTPTILDIDSGNSLETVNLSIEKVQNFFLSGQKATAIFNCNDWMALGCLHAANSIGKKVPKDLSVIGFDNILISEVNLPGITTVDQNMQVLGQKAADRLFALLNGSSCTEKIFLETNLIIRESTSAPCTLSE